MPDPVRKAPLLDRLEAIVVCLKSERSPYVAQVSEGIRALRKAQKVTADLRAKLVAEQRRPKWNGKT